MSTRWKAVQESMSLNACYKLAAGVYVMYWECKPLQLGLCTTFNERSLFTIYDIKSCYSKLILVTLAI